MYVQLLKRKHWLLSLFMPLMFAGCHVMLIGAYDQNVDESIQKISTDISTLIVTVEKNIDDGKTTDNKYENFRDNYINILAQVETLKIRTLSLPKYQKVTQQVELLEKNIQDIEALHKIGFTNKTLVETSKTLIETSLKAMLTAQNALKRESAN